MVQGLCWTAARRQRTNLENVSNFIALFLRRGSTGSHWQMCVRDCCAREGRLAFGLIVDPPIAFVKLGNASYVHDGYIDSMVIVTDN